MAERPAARTAASSTVIAMAACGGGVGGGGAAPLPRGRNALSSISLYVALAAYTSLAACSSPDGAPAIHSSALGTNRPPSPAHIDKLRHPRPKSLAHGVPTPSAVVRAASSGPNVTYHNGPLIGAPEVYAVFWGSSVDPATVSGLPGFFTAITSDAPFMRMLSEYDINSYTIGSGSFAGAVVDVDAPKGTDDGTGTFYLSDLDIQVELARLIATGQLPAADGHNLFMVYLDAHTLTTEACKSLCAYHNSFPVNGVPTYYALVPDLGHNGCESGCGAEPTTFGNLCMVSSHELVEAMTDADVGAADDLAWLDDDYGEIADICTRWDGVASGYPVQSMWSNESAGCRDHRPATVTKGDIVVSDTVTLAPGGTAEYQVTATGAGPLKLEVFNDMLGSAEFPYSFTPAVVKSGESSLLRISVPAEDTVFGLGRGGYSLTALLVSTDADGVHRSTNVALNVVAGRPAIAGISPASDTTNGGARVTVTGTHFAHDAIGLICGSIDGGTCANEVVVDGHASDEKTFVFTAPGYRAGNAFFMIMNPSDFSNPAHIPFTYKKGVAPTITGIEPKEGPMAGGTSVTITGRNLGGASNTSAPGLTINFGHTPVTAYTLVNTRTIRVSAPPATSAGPVSIAVTNAEGQTSALAKGYVYTRSATSLTMAPATGASDGGTYVAIRGDGIQPGAIVTFGGRRARVKVVNPNFVGVLAPKHAPGTVPVVVTNPGAPPSAPLSFTYTCESDGGGAHHWHEYDDDDSEDSARE